MLRQTALSQDPRPFVYRVLLPLLARLLAWATHGDVVVCLMILYVVSAIGMFLAFKYLYASFYKDSRSGIISFVFCMVVFLVTLMETHAYDLATAAFFCLAAALIVRGKQITYMLVFPFITLNRETSFLLVLFWTIYEFNRIPTLRWLTGLAYQALIWVIVRATTMYIFADNPGSFMYWRLGENLADFTKTPTKTLILFAAFGFVLWLAFRNWNDKPAALRTAFVVMLPIQILLHFLAGYPYEIRVYTETLPFAFLLATWRPEKVRLQESQWSGLDKPIPRERLES